MAKYNLSHIPDITTIEEAYNYYNDMIKYVDEIILKNNIFYQYTSGDIVNDVILRLHKYFEEGKIINGGYIALTLWSQKNRYDTKDTKTVGIPDYLEVIDPSIEIIEEKENIEKQYNEIDIKLKNLHWYKKTIYLLSLEMKMLELSRQTKIEYQSLLKTLKEAKKELGIK